MNQTQQNAGQQGQQMQQGQQAQQGQAMLTSKNLTILEDQLNAEDLTIKKMEHYAQYAQDTQIKDICSRAAQLHKQHFNFLLSYLNSHNKPMQQ